MTLKNILDEGKDILQKNHIENSDYDATEILLNLIDMDMAKFLFECDEELENRYSNNYIMNLITEYQELISARASHFPLQYIIGETYFCGLKFYIDRNVLIPRPDTEILVEKVLEDNPDKNKYILDLCTGSGCIGISLSYLGEYKVVIGTDISNDALTVASKNAEDLINNVALDDEMDRQVYFLQSDLFNDFNKINENLGIEKFDIITANPPYIKTNVINSLQDEVKKYEPRLALDGDKDGLKFYKRIASEGKGYLNENGRIYLEIGYDQAEDVKKIFEDVGYTYIDTVKDLGGNDRVIIFTI